MVRMRPIAGLMIAGICAWVWADSSFANRAQDLQAPIDSSEPVEAVTASESVPVPPIDTLEPGSPEATTAIGEITLRVASLAADYSVGSVDCSTALAQVDQCVQTLDTQYLGCETMPAWQDCRSQCVEFQATLPCCEEIVISDVLINEEIIGEMILDPIPMDETCLPPCDAAPFGGDYGSCGSGCGGGGGGGGGGGFGGGLLGAGLGAAALAVGLADDDSSSRRYDGT